MIEKSESIASLAKALAVAQGKFPAAKFDATNAFLKNKYASLGSIIEAAKPILAENGLSVSQLMIGGGDHIGVSTVLLHSSGEWIESTVVMPINDEKGKSAAQAAGSVVTYLRRYALASILGIYADDDTDGQQASGNKKVEQPATKKALEEQPGNGKPTASMDLETAKAVRTRDGTAYGDLDAEGLKIVIDGISSILDSPTKITQARREDLSFKLDAAKVCLANMK